MNHVTKKGLTTMPLANPIGYPDLFMNQVHITLDWFPLLYLNTTGNQSNITLVL